MRLQKLPIVPRVVQLTTANPDILSMKFVTYIWLNRTWTCNSLARAKRVPSYTISQYNIRLYSSNHNIYGNGYEDYNIFYQGLIFSGRRGGTRTHTGMILSHLSAADWITRPYFERDWYHLTLSAERRTCLCNHFVVPNWLHTYYITLDCICQGDLRKNIENIFEEMSLHKQWTFFYFF